MDRIAGLLLALLVASAAPVAAAAAVPTDGAPRYAPDQVVVRFKPGVSASERADARRDRDATVEEALLVPRAQLLELEGDTSVAAAAADFERDPRVEFAEPNYVVRAASNDPLFQAGYLWGLENLGAAGGLTDADVDAPDAWSAPVGGAVTVGVVDTGVVLGHPDLAGRLLPGYDFVDDDTYPTDLALPGGVAHGTHVAGTIAAVRDNGQGGAGVADQARIMPLRVLDEDGQGTTSDIANAFTYASQRGVRVVNASLGGSADQSNLMATAIANAASTLFVVAAGNDGRDVDVTPRYPCAFTLANVLCVAASDRSDARAPFSNHGDQAVDVAAPGVDVTGTHARFDLVASQGFEVTGPLPSGWTNQQLAGSGVWGVSGLLASGGTRSLAIQPAPGTNTAAATTLNLGTRQGCQLLVDLRLEGVGDDALIVETRLGTGAWTAVVDHQGRDGRFFVWGADLPAGSVGIRFRYAAGTQLGGRFAAVDELLVYCPTSNYASVSGTSTAAPHVSGAAALVLSKWPSLGTAAVKNQLLSTGDLSACWTGLTVSSRRLNVARALGLAIGPGPTASTCGGSGSGAAPAASPGEPVPVPPSASAEPPATGTPQPGVELVPEREAPDDRTAPLVSVAVPRIVRLERLLARGLDAVVRCSERCTVSARLYARSASGSPVLVGRSLDVPSRGRRVSTLLRLTRRGRAFLRRGARRRSLTLSVSAADRAGNVRKLRRPISMRTG